MHWICLRYVWNRIYYFAIVGYFTALSYMFLKPCVKMLWFCLPSKHFNVGSTLFIGWYDVETSCNVKSMLNNVVYVYAVIYNVQQRWNNVVCFNVKLNNVRQRRNNVVIFNVDFHNVGKKNIYIYILKIQIICWTQNLLNFFPILRGICKIIFA